MNSQVLNGTAITDTSLVDLCAFMNTAAISNIPILLSAQSAGALVKAMTTSVTAQPVAVPDGGSNAELHLLRHQVYEVAKRLADEELDSDDVVNFGKKLCKLSQVCTDCHGEGDDGDAPDANGEGGWIGRCGKCSGTGINHAAPAAQGDAMQAVLRFSPTQEQFKEWCDRYGMQENVSHEAFYDAASLYLLDIAAKAAS